MKPPQDAERIILDVSSRVEVDRDRLRELVCDRFVPGAYWHDLIEAERVAGEMVEDAWDDMSGDCDRALADVHELYLVQAPACSRRRRTCTTTARSRGSPVQSCTSTRFSSPGTPSRRKEC
jgi:hypothetical protein